MNNLSFFINNIFNKDFFENVLYVLINHNNKNIEIKLINFVKIYKTKLKEYENKEIISLENILLSLDIIEKIINNKNSIVQMKLNYDNILEIYPLCPLYILTIVNDLKTKQKDEVQTSKILESNLELYYKFKDSLEFFDTLDKLKENSNSNTFEILDYFRNIKETIDGLNKKIFNPNSETLNVNALSDYLIFSNKVEDLDFNIVNVSNYLSEKYSLYNLGFNIYDQNLEGIDNSSVNIIAAPSNHGKSLLLINLAKNFILFNSKELNENDCVIFITIEDSLYKFLRRVLSVFGNLSSKFIKELFYKLSYIEKEKHKEILQILFNKTIQNITKSSCNFIFKHANESVSMSSVEQFVNKIKSSYKYNVKGLFIDYIDVMIPNLGKSSNTYLDQGDIVINMRDFVKVNNTPIFTVSQCNRSAENVSVELSNQLIGDSYNKIRFGDNITLMRQRPDSVIDKYIDEILKNKNYKDKAIEFITITNPTIINDIIPTEIKITKCKDGPKNISKFMLFNQCNLRYYDYLEDMINDQKLLKNNEHEFDEILKQYF